MVNKSVTKTTSFHIAASAQESASVLIDLELIFAVDTV
jgi:hypothetical protein